MTFAKDMAVRYAANGVAASKIGIGPGFQLPETGDALTLTETPGQPPYRTHNDAPNASTVKPSMQVMARSATYDGAMTLAMLAWTASFDSDVMINGARYLWVAAQQEPFPIGLDGSKRVMVAFHVNAEKRP